MYISYIQLGDIILIKFMERKKESSLHKNTDNSEGKMRTRWRKITCKLCRGQLNIKARLETSTQPSRRLATKCCMRCVFKWERNSAVVLLVSKTRIPVGNIVLLLVYQMPEGQRMLPWHQTELLNSPFLLHFDSSCTFPIARDTFSFSSWVLSIKAEKYLKELT